MALKIAQSATFRWPVKIMIPVDGGRHDSHTFDVEFARKSTSDVELMVAKIATGELTEFDAFRDLVKGWSGVVDDNGEIPFSESALKMVLDIPTAGIAILNAYKEATGEVARRKN
jgi:hypothetical protein